MKLAVSALFVGSAAAFSVPGAAHSAIYQNTARSAIPSCSATAPLVDVWAQSPSVKVQGSTLKTWDIGEQSTERVQLSIKSDGRPIEANVELWHTPSYVPTKFRIYTENGDTRPVDAVIETPKHPKTVAVYNKGSMEFPFDATVANTGLDKAAKSLAGVAPKHVQGGQISAYTFGPDVDSVQVLLSSADVGERNMKAKIELTQGPNQVKQYIEVYASSGYKNPFYITIKTPGSNNAIRVINQNTVEFPFDAWVVPYEMGSASDSEPVLGGAW